MIYSGRLVDAPEAREIGLLSRIVPQDELLETARSIAQSYVTRSSPLGLRLSKQVLNETVTGISMENALKLENRNQALASQTDDSREARAAWSERRDPTWRDS